MSVWLQFQRGRCPSIKHTPVTISGVQGSPAQATVMARQLQQRRSICSFNALSSIRRMAAGDRETVAAENTEATWERRNGRESAELWVLIRCRGWSMARRASSLIHQQREVAEGEEIWGSCGEWASYIARYPAHLRGLRGFYSHRFYSHIGSFLKHSTHQWPCSNTVLLKKASVIGEKWVFPYVLKKRCSTMKETVHAAFIIET